METIEERDGYRVGLTYQYDPDEPYNDGATPLIRYDTSMWKGVVDADQVTSITSYRIDERILDALGRFVRGSTDIRGMELFARYMSIFHGTRSLVWWQSTDWHYVTFDTQHWRDAMGLTDEYLAAHPEVDANSLANMDEYQAWCEGDVYGYLIEVKQRWRRVDDEDNVVSLMDGDEMTTWEEVEAIYGFYGYDQAVEAAREAFENVLTDQGIDL